LQGVVKRKKIKLGSDIIHVHGWMASMLPVYMKHFYKTSTFSEKVK
jgi:starch synthase